MCHGHKHHQHWGRGCGKGHGKHGGWSRWAQYRGGGWFQPAVNVREESDRYELYLVAPGRKKDDFHLTVKDDVLTIAARTVEGEASDWKRQEYQLAAFERRFELNPKIDPDGIAARYADGILIVTLPKRPGADTPDQEIFVA